ncbi:porin [Ferrimonas senticii]|uniref:porin n=1 Tax=Ferrimonas senticii TaxID=394566 RepID=UPI000410333A|nr:porin [Ferrimonas senticii]
MITKSVIAAAVCASLCSAAASAASLDNLKISGYGTVGIGIASNDAGYADYDSDIAANPDSKVGLQFDFAVNDRVNFTTQLVAKGKYDFEPDIEVAYVSYDAELLTVRAGKLRAPIFMYSDYVDIGYSYPMLRPSEEVYGGLDVNTITGLDLLLPLELGNTNLLLQTSFGNTYVREEESQFGKVDVDNVIGVAANWYVGDWTFRASYTQGTLGWSQPGMTGITEVDRLNAAIHALLDGQDTSFTSLGLQYNDGVWLLNAEAMRHIADGEYWDSDGVSVLLGRQFGSVTPYIAAGWTETTDDDKRANPTIFQGELADYQRLSYSVGARWDLMRNVALKADLTYADYQDTFGGVNANTDGATIFEDDTVVYTVAVDFVF